MINSFEVVTNRRIIYGENKIDEIAGILKWYGNLPAPGRCQAVYWIFRFGTALCFC